jgi:hypothetical protein
LSSLRRLFAGAWPSRVGKHPEETGLPFVMRGEGVAAGERRGVLQHVLLAHPVPDAAVELGGRSDARSTRSSETAVRKHRGAREGARAAAGPAGGEELAQVQVVEDRRVVGVASSAGGRHRARRARLSKGTTSATSSLLDDPP